MLLSWIKALARNGARLDVANEITQTLLVESIVSNASAPTAALPSASALPVASGSPEALYAQAALAHESGDSERAVGYLKAYLAHRPRDAEALNNLGAALSASGDPAGAVEQFLRAVKAQAKFPAALTNLGLAYLAQERFQEAERSFRRALSQQPANTVARANLGLVLTLLERPQEAQVEIDKVLRAAPRNIDALYGFGLIAMFDGRFDEAEKVFKHSLADNPRQPRIWSALMGVRRMTSADSALLDGAQEQLTSELPPMEEAQLRFAVGKYCDDTQDYENAFKSYQRGNELLKSIAAVYDRAAMTKSVDDMIRVYSHETLTQARSRSASDSTKPILVVGMPRSGTSLTEQILASHPAVAGAGEQGFWNHAVVKHDTPLRAGLLDGDLRKKLADEYVTTLTRLHPDSQYVVDKAPVNSDYLGLIHSALPRARIIYVRRDPIDTCLSCYFQPFFSSQPWSFDLEDLAHYYREHARLVAHWRAVLPADSFLEVPYEELVSKQEQWTLKILDFLGLTWDDRCLQFHATQRTVLTASRWQVRQPLYHHSLQRWRNYLEYIGPLRELAAESSGAARLPRPPSKSAVFAGYVAP